MKRIVSAVLVIVMIFSFAGCDGLNQLIGNNGVPDSETTKSVKSPDGGYEILVPDNWKTQTDLNDNASISLSNESGNVYLIVIEDEKSYFEADTNLTNYNEMVIQNMKPSFESMEDPVTTKTTINGQEAITTKIKGVYNKIDITYFLTVVETKDLYCQILSWTASSLAESKEPGIQKISGSFKELS